MTNPRIMIVEDEVLTSLALRNDLRDLGYSVCSLWTSGEKAIEAAEQEKPDVVLMDIRLSGEMDGYSAAKEISSRLDIPIIFMSGFPLHMIEKEAEISEPYEYLSKPVENLDMKKAIDLALQKHKEDLGGK